jgi:hypothetical protein
MYTTFWGLALPLYSDEWFSLYWQGLAYKVSIKWIPGSGVTAVTNP